MNKSNIIKFFPLLLVGMFTLQTHLTSAQCVGQSTGIFITNNIGCGQSGFAATWDGPVGGSIVNGNSDNFTVTWTTPGTFRLKRQFPSSCFGGTTAYTGYYTISATPAAPPVGQLTQQISCGSTTLNYTGGVYDTYWQTSQYGEDLTYRHTRTITSGGTYYARTKSGECWSNAASISATVNSYPNGGSLTGGGSGYLTVSRTLTLTGHAPGTIKEYRYRENGGAEVVVASTSPTLAVSFSIATSTISREYWAVTQSNGCLSNSSSTFVTASPLPAPSYTVCQGDATPMSITRNIGCGYGTGSDATFHGPSGGSISDPGGTESGFTVTWSTPGIYILKRTFPSQCGTSEIYSQSVQVLAKPAAPSASELTQQISCGSTTLNYTGGVYDTYWQTFPGGTDLTYRHTLTITSGGTYYARTKSGECWSNATSISATVNHYPNGGSLTGGGSGYLTVNRTLTLTGHAPGSIKEYRYRENGGAEVVVASTSPTLAVSLSATTNTISREYWAVTQSNGCLSNSSSTSVIASPLPAPSYTVCQGDATPMSITRNIGCGYGTGSDATFHGPSGGSISDPGGTESGFTVTWSTPGIYILKRTFPSQCGTSEIYSQSVQVLAKPAAPSPAELMQQLGCGEVTLNYTGSVYNVFWQTIPDRTLEYDRITKTVTTAGTYYARIKDSNGCWSDASPVVVSSIPPPVVGGTLSPSSATFDGSAYITLSLSGNSASGTVTYWYQQDGGNPIQASGPQVTFSNNTNTTIIREYWASTQPAGCSSANSTSAIITVRPSDPCTMIVPLVNYACTADGLSVELTTDDPGDRWFSSQSSLTSLSLNNTYSLPIATVTLFVQRQASGCVVRTPFSVDPAFALKCRDYLNSIKTTKALVPVSAITGTTSTNESIVYFDGLGRDIQSIGIKGSPLSKDVVQPKVYDKSGREFRTYLPFVSAESNGAYKTVGFTSTGNYANNFYNDASDNIADDVHPFSETTFEPSPLNRVLKQGAPGAAWQPDGNNNYGSTDRTMKYAYEFNSANEVRRWKYTSPTSLNPMGTVTGTGTNPYYAANELYKNKTKDEQHNEVIEYVDKEGRTVLKRVQAVSGNVAINDTNYASTYYVYDDFGNLVCVIPPEGSKLLASTLTPFTWGSVAGLSVSADNTLTKTAATGYANSGAFLSTSWISATANGWARMVAGETNTSRMLGLAQSNAGNNTNIAFALELANDGRIYVWENNVRKNDLGPYQTGTSVMIARESGYIKYYVNDVYKLTSPNTTATTPSNTILQIDVTINETGGTIKDVDISYSTEKSILKNFAFQYAYDGRRRMTMKQVPGAEPVYMVYDDRDRLVLTQDGNQRAGNPNQIKYWTFTKYDVLNRPILTGIKDTTIATATTHFTQADMQKVVNDYYALIATTKPWRQWGETYIGNAANNVHGYSNRSYPQVTSGTTVDPHHYLTVTYYDNYDFRNTWIGNYSYTDENLSADSHGYAYHQPDVENPRVIGQVTGTKTKVLDGGTRGGFTWLKAISYYDDKYRVIQTISDNYKSGSDRASSVYDFVGKALKTKSTHIEADVQWRNLVSVVATGNKLVRPTPTSGGAWNAGASSVQQLAAGQSGHLEFVATETNTNRMIGFSDVDSDQNYLSIDYIWYLMNDGKLQIYEGSVYRGSFGSYATGDVFKIERSGTTIRYYHNNVLKYTSPTASSTLLIVDASLYTGTSTVTDVRASFATTTQSITRRFDYDHAGRLINTWHQLNSQPEVLLTKNEYNELGQLIDKKLHSTNTTASDAKQSVDYRYNIRGWLTSINNAQLANDAITNDDPDGYRDYFGMNLAYDKTDLGLTSQGLFNGNISAIAWSNNQGLGTVKQNGYAFRYDPMNRLTTAMFKEKNATWSEPANNGFDERGLTYDLNGNITKLTRFDRRATGFMDSLVYAYGTGTTQSNRLLGVTDHGDDFKGFVDGTNGGNDYTYDANGNMITDQNKGITTAITYNYLNLPELVTRGTGNTVRYVYDAGGRKLSQITNFGTSVKQTDYTGEYVYENDNLQFINHEEGRIVVANQQKIYAYSGEGQNNITTTSGITLANETLNGEKYLKVTSVTGSVLTGQGITSLGGAFPVVPGERYQFRVKGYRSSEAANLRVQGNGNNLVWPGANLLAGVNNESWVESSFTVPAGVTTVTLGILWNSSATSSHFLFINEVELIRTSQNAAPEYQYHLKDHLGNVRTTFTTKEETEAPVATLETANAADEQSKFLRYSSAKRVNSSLFDRTNGSAPTLTTGHAQRLNGGANEKYGLARSISVMPGDVISTEVYAKYVDTNSNNWTGMLPTLMSQITAGAAGVVVDGATYSASTSTFPASYPGLVPKTDNGGPKAYLNWLVFDRNFGFITGGFQQISTNCRETGADVAHERLASPSITIQEPGYVYVYLSNENPTLVEVYFDDFKVTHTKSPVIQSDDYYPFGLTFNSYQRENSVPNRWKFQGQEHIDDLGLNWDSFKWRNHMPEIGRFFNIDPIADEYVYNSPYAFAENKLGMGVELEGLEMVPFNSLFPQQTTPAPGWHPPMTVDHTTTRTTTTATQSTTTVINTYTGQSTQTTVNRQYDIPGGVKLPSEISTSDSKGNSITVSVSFLNTATDGKNSNNAIEPVAVDGLVETIKKANEMDAGVTSIAIGATTNGNHSGGWVKGKSNHFNGSAIDISLVNGRQVGPGDSTIQKAGDLQPNINENFGPHFDRINGENTKKDQNHDTWIHLSFKKKQ
jgi:RHS repeat-associated protein